MLILVADDDPDFRALAVRALRREFPDAAFVEAGDPDALARVLDGPPPNLLISDLSLNWTDGFDVFKAVRAVAPYCPAVMFTGTGNEELAVRAIKAGFEDYVVKSPKQLRRLAAAARAAVMRTETRRGHEENRALLTQELYHRLHNNLQLVVSLIAFTAQALDVSDAREKLRDLGRRVQALSTLQERLYRGGDFRRIEFAGFIRQLVEDLLALDGRGVQVTFDLGEEAVPVDIAVPMGLIANELVTNALKHAFPAGQAGQLVISFHCREHEGCILEVADSGTGLPTAEAGQPGLGMNLVRRLAQQVGGTVEVGAGEHGGTRCRLTVSGRRKADG